MKPWTPPSWNHFLLWLMDMTEAEWWPEVWSPAVTRFDAVKRQTWSCISDMASLLWQQRNKMFQVFSSGVSLLTQQQEHPHSQLLESVFLGWALKCDFLLFAVGWLKPLCLSKSFPPDLSGPAEPQEGVGADWPPGPLLFLFVLLWGGRGLCLYLPGM